MAYVPFNSFVHFLDCFACLVWFGSLRSRRRCCCCFVFRSLHLARSFLLLLMFFVIFVPIHLHSFTTIVVVQVSKIVWRISIEYVLFGIQMLQCLMRCCWCCCCCCYSLIALCFQWKYPNRIFISLFNVQFRGVNFLVLCNVSLLGTGGLCLETLTLHADTHTMQTSEQARENVAFHYRQRTFASAMVSSIDEVNAFYCRDCSGR